MDTDHRFGAGAEHPRGAEVGTVDPDLLAIVRRQIVMQRKPPLGEDLLSLQPEKRMEGGPKGGTSCAGRLISWHDFGCHSTKGGRDDDKAGIVRVGSSMDVVARGEGIESFYEVGIPMNKHGHALYYSRSIDSGSDMSIPFSGQAGARRHQA